jgi:hypothetical protein
MINVSGILHVRTPGRGLLEVTDQFVAWLRERPAPRLPQEWCRAKNSQMSSLASS